MMSADDERRWYRYPHLFADALRARLAREVGAAGIVALHQHASAWLGRAGLLTEAIQHALAAGAFDDAARWAQMLAPAMLAQGSSFSQLESWLWALRPGGDRAVPSPATAGS